MRELRPIAPGDHLIFLGMGLLGVTIAQTLMVVALIWVPPFNASLLQPSQPVLTLLLGLLLGMERLRVRSLAGGLKLAGIVIGCAGATFTVLAAAERGGGGGGAAAAATGVGGQLLGNALLVTE